MATSGWTAFDELRLALLIKSHRIETMDKANFVVASFTGLEEQLIHCMEYIPFVEGNKDVMSPKFIPIIMETCSLIDSIFREIIERKRLASSILCKRSS